MDKRHILKAFMPTRVVKATVKSRLRWGKEICLMQNGFLKLSRESWSSG